MYAYRCIRIFIRVPGHICVDVLSVCVAESIFWVKYSSISSSFCGDGQIGLSRNLKYVNFIILLFRVTWRHTARQLFYVPSMGCLRPERGKYSTLHIYKCSCRLKKICSEKATGIRWVQSLLASLQLGWSNRIWQCKICAESNGQKQRSSEVTPLHFCNPTSDFGNKRSIGSRKPVSRVKARHQNIGESDFGWFLCLMAYQLFLGYLMPKPFSQKNSSGTI